MKRVLRLAKRLTVIVVLLLPLLLLILPLPLRSGLNSLGLRVLAVLSLYVWGGVLWFGTRFPSSGGRGGALMSAAPPLFAGIVLWLLARGTPSIPLPLAVVAALAAAWLFGAQLVSKRRGAGILSLLACAAALLCLELALQALPASGLKPEIVKTPPLAPPERGREVYRKNGFRCERPCTKCSDHIRIVTMGGSSTYGTPMYYSIGNYTSYFARMLKERRPNERYEVLNGGVPGFGIIQILDALNNIILKHKPHVVTVCAWFNDSALAPGWYGIPGMSDRDAYFRNLILWKLQDLPVYKQLHHTRLFALFRYYLLEARSLLPKPEKARTPAADAQKIFRMSPEEFGWGLERFADLARKHDFLPVLMLEPLNRSGKLKPSLKRNKYYRVVVETAKRLGITLVNPLDAIAAEKDAWLFYDFIHPNRLGHRLIAETLYDTLFTRAKLPPKAAEFLEAHGVDLGRPPVAAEKLFQFPTDELRGQRLLITARAPYAADLPVELEVTANQTLHAALPGLASDWRTFETSFGTLEHAPPITDLIIRGAVRPAQPVFVFGSREYRFPEFVEVVSGGRDHGWKAVISVQGVRFDSNTRGFNAAILGGKSGQVRSSAGFDVYGSADDGRALVDYLKTAASFAEDAVPPVVILAVNTDGFHNVDSAALADALKSLGGSGIVPEAFESFVFIGSPGASPGTAREERGFRLIEMTFGDPRFREAGLVEIREVKAAGNGAT